MENVLILERIFTVNKERRERREEWESEIVGLISHVSCCVLLLCTSAVLPLLLSHFGGRSAYVPNEKRRKNSRFLHFSGLITGGTHS